MAKETKSNKKTLKILCIIFLCIFLISTFYLVYSYIKGKINETKPNLLDIYKEQGVNIYSEENVENESEKKSEKITALEELQKVNSDIVAYIEIEGTNVSYPVLQAKDNDYYMYRNYKKQNSNDGSIFLDKDVSLNLPSSNFLMYGHNNENGKMFSELLNYKKENYYKEHPTINFVTNEEDAQYEIIAVFYSKVYYQSDKNVFRYYYFVNADTVMDFEYYVINAKKASIYDTGKTAEYGEQLLTLSTCSYHTEDGRFAVVARKVSK